MCLICRCSFHTNDCNLTNTITPNTINVKSGMKFKQQTNKEETNKHTSKYNDKKHEEAVKPETEKGT